MSQLIKTVSQEFIDSARALNNEVRHTNRGMGKSFTLFNIPEFVTNELGTSVLEYDGSIVLVKIEESVTLDNRNVYFPVSVTVALTDCASLGYVAGGVYFNVIPSDGLIDIEIGSEAVELMTMRFTGDKEQSVRDYYSIT